MGIGCQAQAYRFTEKCGIEMQNSQPLLAYHGQQSIKDKYLARVRAHRAADELVQGIGWENGKGCAVGCTLESYEHRRYPIELGIPLHLAHLEDALFERQTPEDA